jgi:hypothetical protein
LILIGESENESNIYIQNSHDGSNYISVGLVDESLKMIDSAMDREREETRTSPFRECSIDTFSGRRIRKK